MWGRILLMNTAKPVHSGHSKEGELYTQGNILCTMIFNLHVFSFGLHNKTTSTSYVIIQGAVFAVTYIDILAI